MPSCRRISCLGVHVCLPSLAELPRRPLAFLVFFVGLLRFAAMTPAVAAVAATGAGGDSRAAAAHDAAAFDLERWGALRWREVGPYRGGRADTVTGVPGDRATYYFGATGGGVWKSTDAGRHWQNVSDGFFGGSIGAVAVSSWDPNVVYAGTGEETVRGNVSEGDGMWKSVDAGKTWKRAGLADSRHIARIRIHPRNPDVVYAAVLGHLFGPSSERGVYRSTDGGATWKRVLFANDSTGAVDLAMDPSNPRILYAGLWRVRRTPYSLESGGPGSGLWKTIDGGDTWTDLSRNSGLPKGTLGIVGVAASPTDPDSVYAVVEAAGGGVFRSRDGGKTWKRTSSDHEVTQRAWYYSRIYADPADAESVYVVNVFFLHSKDGGRTFTSIRVPHGDNHDLWIDPGDPRRMIESNDGGANVSEDGGRSWTPQDNQPTAQIYRVATDNHVPYRIYGAQQDNSALRIASRGQDAERGIGPRDWEPTAGGESGYVLPDPRDPEVVYGGSYGGFLVRFDHRTQQVRDVNPWPDNPMGAGAADLKYRFQWNFPIAISPHDPRVIYVGANVLFKSTDEGQSWTAISPDLTRNDRSKQGPSGGPITKDNTSVEYYDTIFTVAESPRAAGVLWVGSDDGLVHVSRDGGAHWQDVTPAALPPWSQVNSIEPSPFDAGAAYFAATLYKSDDDRPYLFKTTDYGSHWTRIDAGLDREHFSRVVRADPARRGLLYAGTQRGVYVSFDDGGRWRPLQLNLPLVPVTDLTVKDGDLVAATEGRGFWVLDDLEPLRELAADPRVVTKPVHLFTPVRTVRLPGYGEAKPVPGRGQNPPGGVVIDYYLREAPAAGQPPLEIEILDRDSKLVHAYKAAKPEAAAGSGKEAGATGETGTGGRRKRTRAEGAAGRGGGAEPGGGTAGGAAEAAPANAVPAGAPGQAAHAAPGQLVTPGGGAGTAAAPPARAGGGAGGAGAGAAGGAGTGEPGAPGTAGKAIGAGTAAVPAPATAPGTAAAGEESEAGAEAETGGGGEAGAAESGEAGKGELSEELAVPKEPRPSAARGFNRFVWDMTYRRARDFPGMVLWDRELIAPPAAPGSYQVRLKVAGQSATAPFTLVKDPRSTSTDADLEAQQRFLVGIRDKLDASHDALRRIRAVRAQLADLRRRLRAASAAEPGAPAAASAVASGTAAAEPNDQVRRAAAELDRKLAAVEEALYQTKIRSSEDALNYPIRLDDKLNGLASSAALGDYRPTAQAIAVRDQLVAAIDAQLARLDGLLAHDVPGFNQLAAGAGVQAVIPPHPR
jgi:photosystem II stability/assembly factor-like uncharacterized protein